MDSIRDTVKASIRVGDGNGPDYSIPRRADVYRRTAAEHAIRFAMTMVEKAGAHPHLTDAVVLLAEAMNKVADYVDLQQVADQIVDEAPPC